MFELMHNIFKTFLFFVVVLIGLYVLDHFLNTNMFSVVGSAVHAVIGFIKGLF